MQRTQVSELALSSLGGSTPQSRSGLKNDESLAGRQSWWSINSSSQLMIVQSLGGMEIGVGMSSLAGGLVLDKSELVQGSKLPINYLFTSTPMPLTSNVYHVGWGINTISRHDCCDHTSSHINSCEPYPALCTLVERSEGVSRDADKLDEWYHSDSLFGFAITAHSNRIVWMGRLERDVVLNQILSMGIYDWKDTDKQGGGSCPVMSIWYTAVLGNWLLWRIEQGNDKVGFVA